MNLARDRLVQDVGRMRGQFYSRSEACKRLSVNPDHLRTLITQLVDEGVIRRVERGFYEVANLALVAGVEPYCAAASSPSQRFSPHIAPLRLCFVNGCYDEASTGINFCERHRPKPCAYPAMMAARMTDIASHFYPSRKAPKKRRARYSAKQRAARDQVNADLRATLVKEAQVRREAVVERLTSEPSPAHSDRRDVRAERRQRFASTGAFE